MKFDPDLLQCIDEDSIHVLMKFVLTQTRCNVKMKFGPDSSDGQPVIVIHWLSLASFYADATLEGCGMTFGRNR
jgi:hypothetical protein